MSDWSGLVVLVVGLAGWYLVQRVVLPKLGVPT